MSNAWRPSWDKKGRQPAFVDHDNSNIQDIAAYGMHKYLWGNVPALDLVNIEQNEGTHIAKDFYILFAASSAADSSTASGDLRNVVKSLSGLPATYTGQCDVVINDRDPDIVARNVILLLTALNFSPDVAATIMVHVWYSTLIPAATLQLLRRDVLPLIEEVCAKIQAKPAATLLSKIWKYGTRSLRLVLRKQQWDDILSYFEVPDSLSTVQAQSIRTLTTLAPEREDYFHRSLYTQPPAWRVCSLKFRQDGILLPFGSSREAFDTPNPTFYQTNDRWPMFDSADPLQGWPIDEIVRKAPPAKNDMYGSLFFYVQDALQQFCQQIGRLDVSFKLFQVDALELPNIIKQYGMGQHSFDRIEVSNIVDRGYLGLGATLTSFGPLLKQKTQNPNATLVALFLNAIHEVCIPADYIKLMTSEMAIVRQYVPINSNITQQQQNSHYNADFLKQMDACVMFRDLDEPFQRYMHECRFRDIGKVAGLEMKSKNTIVQPWPMRLSKNTTQTEFDILQASGHSGCERYVEWRSLG
ncbi:MAG: hypothetical protein M1834_004517 [Cirrosporium novae-zelandiae]|nr:MAG: hypothetical protein M1834_004517 [Cirrosporium novae-zelandiae]